MASAQPVSRQRSRRGPKTQPRSTLTSLWFVWSGLLFATLLFQSVTGYYGSRVSDAWGWFVPLVSPTLAAIVGVFVIDQKAGGTSPAYKVSSPLYQISYWISVAYLAVITFTIYVAPVAWSRGGIMPIDLLKMSQLWILPLQALVAASLGAVFVTRSAQP